MKISMGPDQSTSGLVFYFDISNIIKSWRGKSTTNYLTNPTQIFNSGEFSQYYDLRAIFETNGLVPYSLSFDMRANKNGSVLWYMQNGSYTKYSFVNINLNATTNWQRFKIENVTPTGPTASWQANTPGDNRAMLATYTTYGSGVLPQVTNMQLELGAIATPFVNGSRSSTESVLDLTGFNTITVNGLTYASDGSFSFNGTSDRITVTCASSLINLSNSTIEFVIKLPVYSGGQRCIMSYRGGGGGSLYIGKGSGGIFTYYDNLSTPAYTVGSIPDNSTAHVAVVCDSTNNLILHYINGVLAGSASRTGWVSTFCNTFSLGYDPGGTNEYMLGSMYLFKHYNRVLSAGEIRQNFNAVRSRYGI